MGARFLALCLDIPLLPRLSLLWAIGYKGMLEFSVNGQLPFALSFVPLYSQVYHYHTQSCSTPSTSRLST